MFDTSRLEWPSPPVIAPPEEVIDCLVEDGPGVAGPVRWSEYLPDGLLADLLAQPAEVEEEHREFEALERVGGWERVIAWAQARQLREMTSFMDRAEARNKALGACDSQANDSAVAEVGLMLRVSARTAAGRVSDAWSLCTRLPATLAALEQGRITLSKARILDAETMNLSDEHTAAVEAQVLAKAAQQTPSQLRAATRRAVVSADPAAARERAEQARRERGVQLWPEPDGMATLSAYLPAAEAVGVFAVLDEHARRAGLTSDERSMAARRGDALVDLVLGPTGFSSAGTRTARDHSSESGTEHHPQISPEASTGTGVHEGVQTETATAPARPATGPAGSATGSAGSTAGPAGSAADPAGCWCACGQCRRGGGVDVRITVPYTALLGAEDQPGELATGRSRPRWPETWPPGAPGGASSPTPPRAVRWTTAPPAIGPQRTWPGWSSPGTRPASSLAAGCRPTAATSTTPSPTTQPPAPARPARSTSVRSAGATTRSNRPPAGQSPSTRTAALPGPPPAATSTTPNHHH